MQAKTKAFAYLRVSGIGQVCGTGFGRQLETIETFAPKAGYQIVGVYRDAHTGTEADRPAFETMLLDILTNGVRTIIVESMDRFARDLMVQIRLLAELRARGISLVNASTGQDVTAEVSGDPMREAMITMQGVFAQLDKKLLVRKLAKARQAIRDRDGRCEGRKPFGDKPGESDVVQTILTMRRATRRRGRQSFAQIAAALNTAAVPTRYGKPWKPGSVYAVVKAHSPRLTAA
jgi:DNA invertase Pin-like site-specific DNA recombinase